MAVCRQCPGVGSFGDAVVADGLKYRCNFVPPERAVVDCPFLLQSGVVRCCGGNSILVMACEVGSGWSSGHLVVWSLRGLRFFQSCADGGADVMEGGRGWGVCCRIAPGEVVTRRILWGLLYHDGDADVVLRPPSFWTVVQGAEGDRVVMLSAVECKEGVEALPVAPGWTGVGRDCCLEEGPHGAVSALPERVIFWAPLVVAPFLLPPPLEGSWRKCW